MPIAFAGLGDIVPAKDHQDPDIDPDGYYRDPNKILFDRHDLKIYGSQYNIARELMNRVHKNVLPLHQESGQPRKFKNINPFFLGPAFVDLKDQTMRDLRTFLIERTDVIGWSANEIEIFLKSHVINSPHLKTYERKLEKMPWVDRLLNEPQDYLHLLVFDEAHWGIAQGSLSETFFAHLLAKLRTMAVRPALVIVKISATIDVLTQVISQYGDDETGNRVDWSKLRRVDYRFSTPNYRALSELKLVNVDDKYLGPLTKVCERSAYICDEYTETIRQWTEQFIKPGGVSWRLWKEKGAYEALKYVLPGRSADHTVGDAKSAVDAALSMACASSYDSKGPNNHMIVVRLKNRNIKTVVYWIRAQFRLVSRHLGRDFCAFEVIEYVQDSPPIAKQLSDKGQPKTLKVWIN